MRDNVGDVAASERIYDLASDWARRVIPNHDSLLTPGTRIWTPENLRELEVKFIDRPDESSGKSFLAKLQEQLRDASPGAVQLMAELHLPFFWWVWQGAISASKKLSDLNAILSWHPDRPSVPAEVTASLSPGFSHPGQWAMQRRDTQLACLIWVAVALQELPKDELESVLMDPFAFREVVLNVASPSSDTAKHGLLHLVHPDTFESITSVAHKKAILKRFSQYAAGETDVDRALLKVRKGLNPTYGEGFNFYGEAEDPLLHLWSKGDAWKRALSWLLKLQGSVDLDVEERTYKVEWASVIAKARTAVLDDQPDWQEALRRALDHPVNNMLGWRVKGTFKAWATSHPDDALAALRNLWGAPREASTKEVIDAFAEAVRPGGVTAVGAAVNLATVLLMVPASVAQNPPVKVSVIRQVWKLAGWGNEPADTSAGGFVRRAHLFFDEVVRESEAWEESLRDRLDAQGLIWTLGTIGEKPPSWTDDEWEKFVAFRGGGSLLDDEPPAPDQEPSDEEDSSPRPKDFIGQAAKDLHVDRSFLDKIVTLLEDKGQIVLYGPPGTGKTYLAKRLAMALVDEDLERRTIVQFHPATTYEDFFEGLRPTLEAGTVQYELRKGPLARMVEQAKEHKDKRFVMVIDELNRANLPKVFGELLFLLEYRDEKVATLYRPDELFDLPKNVCFIATMNTADRSVALVDAALRRRFHFIPFFPHLGEMKGLLRRWLDHHGSGTAVADLLDAVNTELAEQVGDHLVIGPSHFMKEDLSEEALERIWEFNIYPTLEEMLWGRHEELRAWRWPEVRMRYASALKLPDAGGVDDPAEA